jgi:hypothetical protein
VIKAKAVEIGCGVFMKADATGWDANSYESL